VNEHPERSLAGRKPHIRADVLAELARCALAREALVVTVELDSTLTTNDLVTAVAALVDTPGVVDVRPARYAHNPP
jgi:hypothetical protein